MSEPDNRSTFPTVAAWALGGLLALAVAYVGSYFALATDSHETLLITQSHEQIVPTYRLGGDAMRPFFDPIHQVDLRLRPERWAINPLSLPIE